MIGLEQYFKTAAWSLTLVLSLSGCKLDALKSLKVNQIENALSSRKQQGQTIVEPKAKLEIADVSPDFFDQADAVSINSIPITISGKGFEAGMQVTLAGSSCDSLTITSDTVAVCVLSKSALPGSGIQILRPSDNSLISDATAFQLAGNAGLISAQKHYELARENVFRARCYSCHGSGGRKEAGFDIADEATARSFVKTQYIITNIVNSGNRHPASTATLRTGETQFFLSEREKVTLRNWGGSVGVSSAKSGTLD